MLNQYGILWGVVNCEISKNNKFANWGYLIVHVVKDKDTNKELNNLYFVRPVLLKTRIGYVVIDITRAKAEYMVNHNTSAFGKVIWPKPDDCVSVMKRLLSAGGEHCDCNFKIHTLKNGQQILKLNGEMMGISMPTEYSIKEFESFLKGRGSLREIFWGEKDGVYYTASLNDKCEVELKPYTVTALLTNYDGKYANIVKMQNVNRPVFKDSIFRKLVQDEKGVYMPVYPEKLDINLLTACGVHICDNGDNIATVDLRDSIKRATEAVKEEKDARRLSAEIEAAKQRVHEQKKGAAEQGSVIGERPISVKSTENMSEHFNSLLSGTAKPNNAKLSDEVQAEDCQDVKEEAISVEDDSVLIKTDNDNVTVEVDNADVVVEIDNDDVTVKTDISDVSQFLHPLEQDIENNYYLCKPYNKGQSAVNREFRHKYGCFGRYGAAIRWLEKFDDVYSNSNNHQLKKERAKRSIFKLMDNAVKNKVILDKRNFHNLDLYTGFCYIFYPEQVYIPTWDLMLYGSIKSTNFNIDSIEILREVLKRYKALYTVDNSTVSHKGAYLSSYIYALIHYDTGVEDIIDFIYEQCPNIIRSIKKFGAVNLNSDYLVDDLTELQGMHEVTVGAYNKEAVPFNLMGLNSDGVIKCNLYNHSLSWFQNCTPVEQALTILCYRLNKNTDEVKQAQGYYRFLDGETYLDNGYLIYNASPLFLFHYKKYVEDNFRGGKPIQIDSVKDSNEPNVFIYSLLLTDISGYCKREVIGNYNTTSNYLGTLELRVKLLDDMTERLEVLKYGLYDSYTRYIKKFTTQLEMQMEKAFIDVGIKFCEGILYSIGYTDEERKQILNCFKQLSNRIGINLVFPICIYLYKNYYGYRDVYWPSPDNDDIVCEHMSKFEDYKSIINNEVFSDFLNVATYVKGQKDCSKINC